MTMFQPTIYYIICSKCKVLKNLSQLHNSTLEDEFICKECAKGKMDEQQEEL